jgi:hypothetical protein
MLHDIFNAAVFVLDDDETMIDDNNAEAYIDIRWEPLHAATLWA